jgi:hypothetical protein
MSFRGPDTRVRVQRYPARRDRTIERCALVVDGKVVRSGLSLDAAEQMRARTLNNLHAGRSWGAN